MTVRRECLDWLLIGIKRHLRRVLLEYLDHYHTERSAPRSRSAPTRPYRPANHRHDQTPRPPRRTHPRVPPNRRLTRNPRSWHPSTAAATPPRFAAAKRCPRTAVRVTVDHVVRCRAAAALGAIVPRRTDLPVILGHVLGDPVAARTRRHRTVPAAIPPAFARAVVAASATLGDQATVAIATATHRPHPRSHVRRATPAITLRSPVIEVGVRGALTLSMGLSATDGTFTQDIQVGETRTDGNDVVQAAAVTTVRTGGGAESASRVTAEWSAVVPSCPTAAGAIPAHGRAAWSSSSAAGVAVGGADVVVVRTTVAHAATWTADAQMSAAARLQPVRSRSASRSDRARRPPGSWCSAAAAGRRRSSRRRAGHSTRSPALRSAAVGSTS